MVLEKNKLDWFLFNFDITSKAVSVLTFQQNKVGVHESKLPFLRKNPTACNVKTLMKIIKAINTICESRGEKARLSVDEIINSCKNK